MRRHATSSKAQAGCMNRATPGRTSGCPFGVIGSVERWALVSGTHGRRKGERMQGRRLRGASRLCHSAVNEARTPARVCILAGCRPHDATKVAVQLALIVEADACGNV